MVEEPDAQLRVQLMGEQQGRHRSSRSSTSLSNIASNLMEGNEGLAGFKAKWDTETRTLMRYHSPPLSCGQIEYSRPADRSWPRRLALAAWHGVPLSVTALAGEQVYRFL